MRTKKILKTTLAIFLSFLTLVVLTFLTFAAVKFIQYKSIKETGVPKIYVNTEGGAEILSKEEYVKCTVTISGAESEYCIENAGAGIRGRGNTTWFSYPKKPYRVKFDEKISLFGEKANKSWVLLAMYGDFSYIKDRLAFGLADALGTDVFVPSYNYAELYLNGKYNGLYLITDQVDENKGRAEVKTDFDETAVSVPFLVELDAYAPDEGEEGIDWFSVAGYPYNIKYPEADERYTEEQFEYIKSYITTVDMLCRKPGVTMEELSEYVDMDSFMDYYIVSEVMGQMEINWKSVYMSKAIDGKLKMGPIWDFDFSVTGSHAYYKERDIYKENYEGLRSVNNWFASLLHGSPEFKEVLSKRWKAAREILEKELENMKEEKKIIADASKKDHIKWHWFALYKGSESCSDEVIEWCENRILWLDTIFNA